MSFQAPPRLTPDQVPAEHRTWAEAALIGPLNRALEPIGRALTRLLLSQMNMQVLETRLTVPASWTNNALEFSSTLSTPCIGIIPMAATLLDAGGQPLTSLGGLGLPAWEEKAAVGRAGSVLRILSQDTVATSSRYRLRWLALGS